MQRFINKYGAAIVAGLLFTLVCLYYLLSPGVYGSTDNVTHFLYSRYAFQYPNFYLHPWARPLYTILSSPFAQLGFRGIQLFNVITGIATAWFAYLIARHYNFRPAIAVLLFTCFMPLYFIMMPTGLTEILFSFLLVFSVWLFLKERYIVMAIVISFLPYARSEGFFLLPFFGLALLYRRKILAVPLLVTGTLFFSLVGWPYWDDFFWVFTKFPYQLHHPIYNQRGDLFHFLQYRDEIIGLPMELLLVAGTIVVISDLFRRGRELRDRSVVLILLVLAPFTFYVAFHSYLYWQGLGASVGLTRVLAGVLPLAAILGMAGWSALLDTLQLRERWRTILTITFTLLIAWITYKNDPFPFPQTPEEETVQRASLWVKHSTYGNKLFYYTDISTPFYMGINPFKSYPANCLILKNCHPMDTIFEGSGVIWDAHFGGNESWIPADSILSHPRMKLIKAFKPGVEWITFGGKPYQCLVFEVTRPDTSRNNYAVLDSINFYSYENARITKLYENAFETVPSIKDTGQITPKFSHSGSHSAVLDKVREYSPGFCKMIRELPDKCDASSMIRVTAWVWPPVPLTQPHTFVVISIEHDNQSYCYATIDLYSQSLRPGEWNKVMLKTRCPEIKSPDDKVKVYVWNPAKETFYVDDLLVELINPE